MPTSMRLVPKGLVTDPSRLVAGDGGLVDAQNVVFRSEGLIEPRAALSFVGNEAIYGLAGFGIDTVPLHSREWDSDTVTAFGSTDDDYLISIARETDAFPLITMGGTYNTAEVRVFSELADGRCIWTLPNGLRCLDQSDQSAIDETIPGVGAFARMPGAPRIQARLSYFAGATTFLANLETTAYRFTVVRWITTESGASIPVEGAPSDRYVVLNASGVAAGVNITIEVAGHVRPGDEVRIYRVPTNGAAAADPGDEMVLRYSITYDGGSTALTFYDGCDSTEFLGPSLYTNASIEGATRANYRLRTARDLATYQNKLFYAGGDAGWRQSTTVLFVGAPNTGNVDGALYSTQDDATAADWGIGDTTITSVGANMFQYLSVGQWFTGPCASPETNTSGLAGKVVSWDAGALTVTIDTPATLAGTNQRTIAWDWVSITDEDDNEKRIYAPKFQIGTWTLQAPATGATVATTSTDAVLPVVVGGSDGILAGAFEMTFNDTYGGTSYSTDPKVVMYSQTGTAPTDPWSRGVTISAEYDGSFANPTATSDPDQMSFAALPRIAITSSRPGAFTTPVGRTYDESVKANRESVATLWWSKINQPESVPLGNFAIVGESSQPISRIFATTDRLWILKPDGLYCAQGSGDTEDAIVITLVDGTFRMIDVASDEASGARCSTWAAKCKDTVFAWTRNGIVAINSGGVTRVDGAIETDIRAITPSYNATQVEQTLGTPFCSASEREAIVVFGSSGIEGESPLPGCCYVYHVETGAWATWTAIPNTMSSEGVTSDFLVPTHCGGYGASVSGLLRMPNYFGYLMYLDVPSNNTARLASTALADDVYPVTGDRVNVDFWANTITSVTDNVVTWDNLGPATIPGARWQDAAGDWFWTLSTSYGIETLSVVSGTPIVGALQDCHYAVDRVVTFAANQPPFSEKHWLSCWAHFQLIRAGTQFAVDWRARGHVAGEAPTLTVVYDQPIGPMWADTRLENDLEYDKAISIPTEVGRSRGVELTITQAQADVFFAMDGLTMQYEAETVRIEGRR